MFRKNRRTGRRPLKRHNVLRSAMERLEDRIALVVGAFAQPAAVIPGTGFDGVVSVNQPANLLNIGFGTGTLLTTGRHIVTAAHVVDADGDHAADGPVTVQFDLATGPIQMQVPAADVTVHENWPGAVLLGAHAHDLAILKLPAHAPLAVNGFDIYRNFDEVGKQFRFFGYGLTGTGALGQQPNTQGTKRSGFNTWDAEAALIATPPISQMPNAGTLGLVSDFDNGSAARDTFGVLYNRISLGLGNQEATGAPSDSGGPAFINGRIAGINNRQVAGFSTDTDTIANATFGEIFMHARVSAFAGWIDQNTLGRFDLIIDMASQPVRTDGLPNAITATWINTSTLRVSINGVSRNFAAANINSLTIRGSAGQDQITVEGGIGRTTTVDGLGGNDTYTVLFRASSSGRTVIQDSVAGNDTLTVNGIIGTDSITVSDSTVRRGNHTVEYTAGVNSLTVTGGSETFEGVAVSNGNDSFSIHSTAANTPLTINAGNAVTGLDVASIGRPVQTPLPFFELSGIRSIVQIMGAEDINVLANTPATGQPINRTGDLFGNSLTALSSLSGLGLGAGGSLFFDTAITLDILLGSGDDTFKILSTPAGRTTNLLTAGGQDTVILGSTQNATTQDPAGNVNGIAGDVIIDGSAGPDILVIQDAADGAPPTNSISFDTATATGTVLGFGMPARVTYRQIEFIEVFDPAALITVSVPNNSGVLVDTNGAAGVVFQGSDGDDRIHIWFEPDVVVFDVNGEPSRRVGYLTGGTIIVLGGGGNDRIDVEPTLAPNWRVVMHGEEGDDQLFGGAGAELLDGGEGNDYLEGGAGEDVIFGGPGHDIFRGDEAEDRDAEDELQFLVTAPDAGGGPHVAVFDPTSGRGRFGFFAYEPTFTGGVRVATGDVNGDGVDDIITVPGAGRAPQVRVFDGVTGNPLPGPSGSFLAYPQAFTGGVFVAAGDLNGDGLADIITAAGPGGGPHVRAFSGADGSELLSFFAYDPNFRGGVRLATGDVDRDGAHEIITAPGAGGGPHVRVFRGSDGTQLAGPIGSFFAYGLAFVGGVFLAAGDVNGDGLADIITGPGAGGGPHVRVFNATDATELAGFFAYGLNFTGGVRVAAGDADGDGLADIVTGPGPGGGPHVRVFSGLNRTELTGFFAYNPAFAAGVFVAGAAAVSVSSELVESESILLAPEFAETDSQELILAAALAGLPSNSLLMTGRGAAEVEVSLLQASAPPRAALSASQTAPSAGAARRQESLRKLSDDQLLALAFNGIDRFDEVQLPVDADIAALLP